MPYKQKSCIRCKTTFKPVAGGSIYCLDCKKEAYREKERERYHKDIVKTREKNREDYKKNAEKRRLTRIKYYYSHRQLELQRNKEANKNPERKSQLRKSVARWRSKNKILNYLRIQSAIKKSRDENPKEYKQKHAARDKVNKALVKGKIKKKKCEWCGNKYSEAHHSDYSKPLDVIWLCKRCHGQAHWTNI